MPAKKKKELHIAHNVGELNKIAENGIKSPTNCKLFTRTAEQVFKKAEEHNVQGDEESAYIMYMRYFNLISAIKKTTEFKKNEKYFTELIGTKKCIRAITEAEELSASLKHRYEEKKAEEVSKKMEVLELKRDRQEKEKELKDEVEEKESEKGKKAKDDPPSDSESKNGDVNSDDVQNGKSRTTITVSELYRTIRSSESVLIIDVRPPEQFAESHIIHKNCINVPSEIIPPGATNTYIEKALPAASRSLWSSRSSMEHIVLMDWYCNATSLMKVTTLATLKDSLTKWDYYTTLKCEPVVLEGGYDEWLNYYPTLSSNANVSRPHAYTGLDESTSLDEIHYDLDQAFLDPPEPEPAPKDKLADLRSQLEDDEPTSNKPSIPTVDRSLKPRVKPELNNQNGNGAIRANKSVDLDAIKNELKKELNHDKDNVNINNDSTAYSSRATNASSLSNGSKSSVPSSIPPMNNPKMSNIPGVNRSLKPSLDTPEGSAQASADHEAAQIAVKKAQEALNKYQHETRRLVEERRARVAALKTEEESLRTVRQMKQQEIAATADVLRAKRRIQQELAELEEVKKKSEAEENDRHMELDRLKDDESKKLMLKQEAERLRALKKRPEVESRKREESEERGRREAIVAAERKALEQQEAEKKRMDKERREKQERERYERDEKRERQEREREAEIKRLHNERVEKERIEREIKMTTQREETGTTLPVGWQKVHDPITSQYKYIDPSKSVHRTPPGSPQRSGISSNQYNRVPGRSTPTGPSTPEHKAGVYKTKLRDDTDSPIGGRMRRSHSSPNIAQLDELEPLTPVRPYMPSVDRGKKPFSPRSGLVPAKTEVSAAKVRNLQPTWGNVGRGLTGLRNLGNTCYMNSTLQCLSSSTFLTKYFLTDNYWEDINRENFLGKKGEVADEFAVLIKALWTGQYRSINPRDFKNVISKHYPCFAGYDQHDSQEMLLFLLDSLHEDLNKVRKRSKIADQDNDAIPPDVAGDKAWHNHKSNNDSVIVDLFQGQFKSTLTCMTCDRQSVTFDTFMYLTVPIPSKSRCSLRDCIQHFSKEEKMTGDSRWFCPTCKCRRDSKKSIAIWRLPRILLIHLKRFYYDGVWRDKINATVDFPLDSLEMNNYVQGRQKASNPYSLYAVSNHYGTMEGGHYTAFCKSPDNGRWFKYDDHEVSEMSRTDIRSSAAYILYYSSIPHDLHFAS